MLGSNIFSRLPVKSDIGVQYKQICNKNPKAARRICKLYNYFIDYTNSIECIKTIIHVINLSLQHADLHKKEEVEEKTKEEILSLMAHHVTAVNYIYRDTKFDGRNEHRNIKFEVQRIKVCMIVNCH